jgi:hypothetical protein
LKPFLLPVPDQFPKQIIGFNNPILIRFIGMIGCAGPGGFPGIPDEPARTGFRSMVLKAAISDSQQARWS